MGDALGRLVGRARVLGRREGGLAGRLGWLAWAEQAEQPGLRGLLLRFLFLFFISSLLFEFEFGSRI